MRLCQFYAGETVHVGYALNETVLGDLTQALNTPHPLLDFLCDPDLAKRAAGHDWKTTPEALIPITEVRWALPVLSPPKIIGLGLNYRRHVEETPYARPDYPVYFLRLAHTLVAHQEPLKIPPQWPTLDYEGELAVIIGRDFQGRDAIPWQSAVAGYTLFNDASVRSLQFRGPQWTLGKNYPATGAFGPWVVTPDALPEGPDHLRLETRINQELVQQGNTADMIFSVGDIIRDLAQVIPLTRGDVILTGTPDGVGFAQKPPRYLAPDDWVRVRCPAIGELVNPVVLADD